MIQTQSQNRKIGGKAWGEVRRKFDFEVWYKFGYEVGRKVKHEVKVKVKVKVKRKLFE